MTVGCGPASVRVRPRGSRIIERPSYVIDGSLPVRFTPMTND